MPVGARVVICAGLLLALAPSARAQNRPAAVAVTVDPCVPVDHAKLNELLAIELGASTVRGPSPSALTQVYVGCVQEGIDLRLDDGVTRKSMARVLPSSSFVDASSTRLLALAVAEFVVASWIELRASPRAAVEPVGPRPPAAARELATQVAGARTEPPESRPPGSSLSLGMALQLWTSHDALLLGAVLRYLAPLGSLLALSVSGDLSLAGTDVALGSLSITTTSLSAALAIHAALSAVSIYTGPGARIGLAFVDASPREPARDVDPSAAAYGGPIWLLRFELHAATRLRIALDIEAGLTTLPIRANDNMGSPVFDMDDAWLSTTISAGLGF